MHQIRADGRPADALFRQQQTLLRTLPTPNSVLADTLKLYWAWRKRTSRPFLRSIFLVLLALIFTTTTIAASVFSSLVVDTGLITILVDSPHCGGISSEGRAFKTVLTQLDLSVPPYVRNCYKNGSLPEVCNVFTRPSVNIATQNADCPWNETFCNGKNVFSMDSGLVDIGKAFGLNITTEDRISYHRKSTCTVLPIEGHMAVYNSTEVDQDVFSGRGPLPGEEFVTLYYNLFWDHPSKDYAFLSSLAAMNVTMGPISGKGRMFYANDKINVTQGMLVASEAFTPQGDTMFKPFQNNAASYVIPNDDPLYGAHIKTPGGTFLPDYPIRLVGCMQQHQYCHPRNGQPDFCTPFEGKIISENMTVFFPKANEFQKSFLRLLTFSSYIRDLAEVDTALAAQRLNRGTGRIQSMPADYWKLEMLNHEREVWVALQILISQYAIGPGVSDPLADAYYMQPKTAAEKQLCNVQKMKKSGGFVNIKVLGLAFIITFSILVAILDIGILKFLVFLSRFRRALAPRIDRWIQDGVWQLQRRAYEGEGHRNWTDLEADIPLLEDGHKLKDLPIMWLPGKSPAVMQIDRFDSQSALGSQILLHKEPSVAHEEINQPEETMGRKWYMFPRSARH